MSAIPYKLNRKITIEQKTVTTDPDYGTEVITWTTFADNIWADIQDVLPSKSESVKQGLRIDTKQKRVRIRHRFGITSDMRVVIHGTSGATCQIVASPAEMYNRRLIEFVVEAYSS